MIIPVPKDGDEAVSPFQLDSPDADWIRWYLDCPNWVCDHCKATMFGRMKTCVYCEKVLHKTTVRPANSQAVDP